MLCFVVVMQSFIMNSHEVFIHIHQGCFAGTGAIVRLPQCQWSKPDGYGKISQCITTTKHIKAKTVCIFLGIYCMRTRCQSGYQGQGYVITPNVCLMCKTKHSVEQKVELTVFAVTLMTYLKYLRVLTCIYLFKQLLCTLCTGFIIALMPLCIKKLV